ncbi:MAG: YARHG domain-containing protein [Proteobacteria bacterium]|nr:YARHG domain-containing protein [Pseudomonadota bacterium]
MPSLLALLLLACGAPTPVPEAEVEVVEEPTAAPKPAEVEPTPAAASTLDVGCPSELVEHFTALVASGCTLTEVEDGLPMIPRVLRNVPFAARGYRFKSTELTTFFTAAKQGCEEPWYKPTGAEFTLPEAEQACVTKLKAHEATLRKKLDVPREVEAYALTQLSGEILSEIERHRGLKKDGDRVMVSQPDGGGWSLNFYSEDQYEGETFESSSIVMCDAKGACEMMFAG